MSASGPLAPDHVLMANPGEVDLQRRKLTQKKPDNLQPSYRNTLQGNPPCAPSTLAPMANAEIIRATA